MSDSPKSPPRNTRSNIRVSRAHLLRMRELAAELGCVVPSSFHPEMGPLPSAAALVRAIAEGEIKLRRVRPASPSGSFAPQE